MLVENRTAGDRTLLLVILFEVAVFAFTGPHFFSSSNAFEIVRLGVELGLLALALTPIIVTGGIDLSVGSAMGLCAVVFGYLWRDVHLPIAAAAFATLLAGIAAGGLNALAISKFGGAPLIVTLGTYSLYRGVAEGVTRGVDNFSQFPRSFLFRARDIWERPCRRRRRSSSYLLSFTGCCFTAASMAAHFAPSALRRRAPGGREYR